MKQLRVLGIMSGTSLDGIDFVTCDVARDSLQIEYVHGYKMSFPQKLRSKLYACAENKLNVHALAEVHHELGRFYAQSAKKLLKKSELNKLNLVGLHGQTVYHHISSAAHSATLQIGEPAYLAQALGRPVASDFRSSDLAQGGEGAPLATFFHYVAFKDFFKDTSFAIHNLGGISNLSYFPKSHSYDTEDFATAPFAKKVLAFDTGPANMLVDLQVMELTKGKQKFDRGGGLAAKGIPHLDLVHKWLRHSYFKRKPPKSCGREEFGKSFLDSIRKDLVKLSREDQICTLTELTAVSVTDSYRKFLPQMPKVIVFCGGGAFNTHLLFRIRYHLPEVTVLTSSALGWPEQAVEGAAFALLAACRAWGMKAHFPLTTGAKHAAILGKISL